MFRRTLERASDDRRGQGLDPRRVRMFRRTLERASDDRRGTEAGQHATKRLQLSIDLQKHAVELLFHGFSICGTLS